MESEQESGDRNEGQRESPRDIRQAMTVDVIGRVEISWMEIDRQYHSEIVEQHEYGKPESWIEGTQSSTA